jgi:hypothetical protein
MQASLLITDTAVLLLLLLPLTLLLSLPLQASCATFPTWMTPPSTQASTSSCSSTNRQQTTPSAAQPALSPSSCTLARPGRK